jgi:drug/metabolite transporter (DMT)-like permease
MLPLTPHTIALTSAGCSAIATMLIQQGLRRSNFYAGFWINVTVGTVGLWAAVLLLVPRTEYHWGAVPYFIASGLVGTAAGRLFRVAAIEKVGAPVAASINNLSPLIATGLAILVLGEHVTLPIVLGTLVIVLGTVLLSLSGQ